MTPQINPDAPGFNPGAVPSRVDVRDYQWAEVGANSAPFDWNAGYDIEAVLGYHLVPKDQGGSGSCGGQAWSSLAAVIEAMATKSFEERSAKFIYSQTYVPGGGSGGRENAEIFRTQGAAREAVLSSYQNGNPPSEAFMERSGDITDAVRADAKLDRSLSYASVLTDIDSLAQALRDNYGVVIGIDGSNNGTWLSTMPQVPKAGEAIWRHWLYVGRAKLVNGKKCIGVLNSWGISTGDRGWQWISEDYVKSVIHDTAFNLDQKAIWEAWTHIFNPNPAAPTFTHNFARDIPYGENSLEVTALQKALQVDGSFPSTVSPTTFYGDITRRAVLAFQIKYQVAPLSELNSLAGKNVGTLTRAQLNKLFNHV